MVRTMTAMASSTTTPTRMMTMETANRKSMATAMTPTPPSTPEPTRFGMMALIKTATVNPILISIKMALNPINMGALIVMIPIQIRPMKLWIQIVIR